MSDTNPKVPQSLKYFSVRRPACQLGRESLSMNLLNINLCDSQRETLRTLRLNEFN
jgi:hypothetical protein